MGAAENEQISGGVAWDDLSWEEQADRLLVEVDASYTPIDAQPQSTQSGELSYYQQRVLGGAAVTGKFA